MLAGIYTPALYGLLILLLILLVAALIVGYELLRRDFRRLARGDKTAESLERAKAIEQQVDRLRKELETTAAASAKELDRLWIKTDSTMNAKLDKAGEAVRQVRQSLGAINDASQRIVQIGSQLSGLSDALRLPPPGTSGDGTVWLSDLLAQMLPPQHYQLNVPLNGDRAVDAAVRLGQHLVAIDARFPVSPGVAADETVEQIAKRHVDRVAAECIQPDHGTVDFALMYLPTEGLYYDLVIRTSARPDALSNYALSRRVIPVSPNTLYAYLYTIVLGLRGLQVERQAERIVTRLAAMREQFDRFQESFRSLGSHLQHAGNRYEQAERQLSRFGDRMSDALHSEGELPGLLDGPTVTRVAVDSSPGSAIASPSDAEPSAPATVVEATETQPALVFVPPPPEPQPAPAPAAPATVDPLAELAAAAEVLKFSVSDPEPSAKPAEADKPASGAASASAPSAPARPAKRRRRR